MLRYRQALRAVGWSDRVEAAFSELHEVGLAPARVVNVERGGCTLVTTHGESFVPEHGLAVGDWTGLADGSVAGVLERWSQLARVGPDGALHLLAVNVDVILIAVPADRLSLARVERELTIAWDSGARPVVVLTKADVAQPDVVASLENRLTAADIVVTSAATGIGLDELRSILGHPTTAVLIGPSGAGKSTLINCLLGEERLAVGAVREDDRRGRHTTTSRRLVPLPSGGCLIDTPGLRSLGTVASDEALASAFPDIDELARGCRFADCEHQAEPGCAVAVAVAHGSLDERRLASYRKLQREAEHERRRLDPLARRAQQQVWKARTKANRKNPKYRRGR